LVAWKRRRSKPTSMMRSNKVSLTSETTTLSLLLCGLSRTQEWFSSDHTQRIYGYEIQ
jgi:hypothetical protein